MWHKRSQKMFEIVALAGVFESTGHFMDRSNSDRYSHHQVHLKIHGCIIHKALHNIPEKKIRGDKSGDPGSAAKGPSYPIHLFWNIRRNGHVNTFPKEIASHIVETICRAGAGTLVNQTRNLSLEKVAHWQHCADLANSHTVTTYRFSPILSCVVMNPNNVLYLHQVCIRHSWTPCI